ncbi:MAG: hypothetical protein HY584_03120 [Candidatus Omnitrophica bacterium]|nr:hypothetical protein [Candidatus Omnitrophota bacterium]
MKSELYKQITSVIARLAKRGAAISEYLDCPPAIGEIRPAGGEARQRRPDGFRRTLANFGHAWKHCLAMTVRGSLFGLMVFVLAGCDKATYPEAKVESAIKEICSKEYKIENVEVKFAGNTIGVFLPLKRLFQTDIRQEILSGQVANLDSLFEPEAEAMDQLENVLFTISRVLLSSDRKLDFYVLQATDVESTGLQLVLMGYMDDVRRVRLWDISRNEYRKRVLHELKFNRSVLWEKPVRGLLRDVGVLDFDELTRLYFARRPTPDSVSPLFYDFLISLEDKEVVRIAIEEMKSRSYRDDQALVYVKLKETFEPRPGTSAVTFSYPSGTELEYMFVVKPFERQFKIAQVIPFYYVDDTKQLRKVPLPPELDLDKNLEAWPERFQVDEIFLGEFLARQLNRRVQALLLADERIRHTVQHAQINFNYQHRPDEMGSARDQPHFALYFDFLTKGMRRESQKTIDQVISDEDVLYLFNLILREFADLVRSYRFDKYQYLELVWEPGGASAILQLFPERLDLFREKKLSIAGLLA